MAAIEQPPSTRPTEPTPALLSLTLAAFALPGLIMQPAHAQEGDAVTIYHQDYQEAGRDLGGMPSKFQPIEVDTQLAKINFTLTDNTQGTLTFTQDTWSGATPVATAPRSARGNRVGGTHTHTTTGASEDTAGHIHDEQEDNIAIPPAQTTTGASPYLYSNLKLDAERRPLQTDDDGNPTGGVDTDLVHTLSSASPEIRRELAVSLNHNLDDVSLDWGGGFSHERDFHSLFGHLSGSWDIHQKRTTLTAGLTFAHNKTQALLDHDVVPHVYEPYMFSIERRGDSRYSTALNSAQLSLGEHAPTLRGERKDWGLNLGVTHVLNQTALLAANLGFTHSMGYQANPYKAVEVAFIDPLKQHGNASGNASANYAYDADLVALLEQRPSLRNQGFLNLTYIQHLDATDAALHTNYRYFQDSWGIKAHSLSFDWEQPLGANWTLTPHIRYYSQTHADFYTPYLITQQGLYRAVRDPAKGDMFIDSRHTQAPDRYYEDATGQIAPAKDTNPQSRRYGQPVVGKQGHAIINQHTGAAVSDQATVDALKPDTQPFDRRLLPQYYASDPRLSAYGTLSTGILLSKALSTRMRLEFSYEYTQRAGSLKLGGGGEGAYADLDAYSVNLGLNLALGEAQTSLSSADSADHHPHKHTTGTPVPAGVNFGHLLENAGDRMLSYRFVDSLQSGDMRANNQTTQDYTLINHACDGRPCYVRPTQMRMRMHMLDIMYAPSEWLTLMLMPQWAESRMQMRLLDESPRTGGMDAIGTAIMHAEHPHTTAGLGDTELHGLIRLFKTDSAQLHLGLGLSAPTGRTDLSMRPMMGNAAALLDYGMQLGSGTWDAKPSLTLTGQGIGGIAPRLGWGAQISGTQRLADHNASGYRLGDIAQSTLWGSYALSHSLSTSVRGLYTRQGRITGEFTGTHTPISSGDYPLNYGGQFMDLGLGLAGNIQSGTLAGTHWGLEWLEPLSDKPEGYQLARKGTLVFTWGIAW